MKDLTRCDGKHMVVTGCSSGIGRATAQLLLELGADVHGLDIQAIDVRLHAFTRLDLRDRRSIEAAAAAIESPVDGLFNCAGIPPGLPPLDVMKVNFIGTRYFTEQVLSLMPPVGAIVNVASNGGSGWPGRVTELLELVTTPSFETAVEWFEQRQNSIPSAYSYSKEALIVWTMSASAELIKLGIRMNCTSPGAVQTPMLEEIEKVTPTDLIDVVAQPIGRRSGPEEQAWPLVFLNSDAASYVNGVVLPVDGGFVASRAAARSTGST